MEAFVDEEVAVIRVYQRTRPMVPVDGWYTAKLQRVCPTLEIIKDINHWRYGVVLLKPREGVCVMKRTDLERVIEVNWCLVTDNEKYHEVLEVNSKVEDLHP